MRIGTRASALAQWQARTVARLIGETGGPRGELVIIRTSGDEPSPGTTSTLGTPGTPGTQNVKRLFVKEIEDALLDGRIDLAVHSSKDLPAALPEGLSLGAALAREDPRDVLILPAGSAARGLDAVTAALGRSPRVGTSSVRRRAELRPIVPHASFVAIRGNVETRLRKLDAGECDVLVLAAAGVTRLALEDRVSAYLPVELCVPAPGQGIVAVEMADAGPPAVRRILANIADADAQTALTTERAAMQALGGGCQMPLGVLATLDGQDLDVIGMVSSLDASTVIRATVRGNRGNPAAAGEKLARMLLEQGAAALLGL